LDCEPEAIAGEEGGRVMATAGVLTGDLRVINPTLWRPVGLQGSATGPQLSYAASNKSAASFDFSRHKKGRPVPRPARAPANCLIGGAICPAAERFYHEIPRRPDNLGGESAGSRIKPRPPEILETITSFDLSGACFAGGFFRPPISIGRRHLGQMTRVSLLIRPIVARN
jgi:hypothetical protein